MTTTIPLPEPRTDRGLRGLMWLTWRQHRWFLLGALAATVVVLAAMLWSRSGLRELVSTMEATRCDQPGQASCSPDLASDRGFYNTFVTALLWYVPVGFTTVVAVFVGAPLVTREYEQETHLLTWSQGITPDRWFLTKTAVLAAAIAVLALVLGTAADSLASAHRAIPEYVQGNIAWEDRYFEASAPILLSYTLFALALGLAAGALVRRTLPAMAITLAAFTGTRWIVGGLRPYFLPPNELLQPLTLPIKTPDWGPDLPEAIYFGYADAAGNKMTDLTQCTQPAQMSNSEWRSALTTCLNDHGAVNYLHQWQPASRVPTFQLIETGIFVALAAVLFVIAWRRVHTRTTI